MNGVCSADGCERKARARGWCEKHYQRWRRNGDPEANHSRVRTLGACEVVDCGLDAVAHNLCQLHYGQCRHRGLGFSAEALREYEVAEALGILDRHGLVTVNTYVSHPPEKKRKGGGVYEPGL